MKIVVTGASGKLGRRVCQDMVDAGHDVTGVDRTYRRGVACPLYVADLLRQEAMYAHLEGCDAVVHLANHPGARRSSPGMVYRENTTTNLHVMHAAAEVGVPRVVFASSIQVIASDAHDEYEDGETPEVAYLPLDRHSPVRITNVYALSKLAGEQMLDYCVDHFGISGVSLRLPWLTEQERIARHQGGRPVRRRKTNLEEAFAFLSWEDAAALFTAAVEADVDGHEVYLAAAKSNAAGRPPREIIEQFYDGIPLRKSIDEIDRLVDTTDIQRDLGWTPRM